MRVTLALALRAALSRAGRGRFLTLAVVGAIVCACWVIVCTAPLVKSREGDRYERQAASEAGEPTALGPRLTQASWRGRVISLVLVPGGVDEGLLPPGLEAPLQTGEARLSPALSEQVDDDPVLAAWFPYRRLPDLPVDAVNSAGEYKAYIGVAPDDLRRASGSVDVVGGYFDAHFGYYQWLGFLLFAGAPALGLMAMSSRFGRRVRRERFAALRLLGMPSYRCRAVLGIETGLPVAIGAGVAAAVAAAIHPHHLVVPIADRWVFGEDARLSASALVATAAAVTALGVALGAATPSERSATGRLRALVAKADVTRAWTAALYAAGVALIAWSWLRAQPRDPLRFVGVLLVGAGIPGVVAYAARVTGRVARWNDTPLVWFLAMRKLAADPRSLSKLAGIVGVVTFVIGVAQPVADVIAQPSGTWVGLARDQGKATVVGRTYAQFTAPLSLPGAPPRGTEVAVSEIGLWSAGQHPSQPPVATALVASCEELEDLLGAEVSGCDGTIQRLGAASGADEMAASSAPVPAGPLTVHGLDGQVVAELAAPRAAVGLPAETDDVGLPGLLVPPDQLPAAAQPFVTQVHVRTTADTDAWEAAQAWVTGASPFHPLENEIGHLGTDSSRNWVILGFAFAATIGAVGASLGSLDEQRSAQEWAALRAIGVPSSSLIAIRLIIAAVSAGAAVVLVLVPAVLVTDAFLRVNGDQIESFAPFVVTAVLGALAVLAVTLASAVLQMRRLGRIEGHP